MTKVPGVSPLVSAFRKILFTLLIVFTFFCGVVTGNLDRLDSSFFSLLQYQKYLPAKYRKFLPGGSAQESTASAKEELSGRIIQVYDGDTATLLSSDGAKKYKIRFFGIDAPEADQEFGQDSRNALAEKIQGQQVKVLVVNTDRYGRNVGKVYREDRYINLEMITGGFAWYYEDYARNERDLEEAQKAAKQKKRGLWQSTFPPIPPWKYRKNSKAEEDGKKQKRSGGSLLSIFH